MKSKMAAAAGNDGFGLTNEWGNDRLWTANGDGERRWRTTNGDAATATIEVGSPPDFFPLSFRFLRFPSDLQNWCMEIVSVFLLFIEIFVSVVRRL